MFTEYDVGIIGAGVSGAFASLHLSEKNKDVKTAVFEFGPPPSNCLRQDPINTKRRRRQLEGWFGCFPNSDGKLYFEDDSNNLLKICNVENVNETKKWVEEQYNYVANLKTTTSKIPSSNIKKEIDNLGMNLNVHTYQQWNPENIHQLSKILSERIDSSDNIDLYFETEVYSLLKKNDMFEISTSRGDFLCKKVILCTGRSGWRWVNKLYKKLGIEIDDDISNYGITVEMPSGLMKDFNKSHCSINKEGLSIGPLNWSGSIIQEDHADITIASFRGNEPRWKTEKVFFSIKKQIKKQNSGIIESERVAKLSFLISGDRVGREKIKSFLKQKSQTSLLSEYNWLPETINEISTIFPNIISDGYFHIPDIDTTSCKIKVSNNLETEVKGLFVAGENLGIKGIVAASIMGCIAADGVVK